jgi:hypothetical protein
MTITPRTLPKLALAAAFAVSAAAAVVANEATHPAPGNVASAQAYRDPWRPGYVDITFRGGYWQGRYWHHRRWVGGYFGPYHHWHRGHWAYF